MRRKRANKGKEIDTLRLIDQKRKTSIDHLDKVNFNKKKKGGINLIYDHGSQ